jgi:hypothetical protein
MQSKLKAGDRVLCPHGLGPGTVVQAGCRLDLREPYDPCLIEVQLDGHGDSDRRYFEVWSLTLLSGDTAR